MPATFAVMILRDLLISYGIGTITEFASQGELSKSQAWNLWHGRSQLGLNLAKQLSQKLKIPLDELVSVDPTPPTPPRGMGGPRKSKD
jgi:antitoxin component HigA of HigAB toxin-antitoxin module